MSAPALMSLLFGLGFCTAALAVPSRVEPVADGVYLVHDDTGAWGGDMSRHITHQHRPEYQARKVLDLSDVPAGIWEATRSLRLSIYLMVRDYSWHDNPPANGLDEAFEVRINGKVHGCPTNGGAPVFGEGKPPAIGWFDLVVPKEEFSRGPNDVVICKAPGGKYDDYLYLGIDPAQQRGNSFVAFDGKTWTQEKLTVPGGNGEYMVRLYLLVKDTLCRVVWQPGAKAGGLEDPTGLILYAGARQDTPTERGLLLAPGQTARLEWSPTALDRLLPARATVQASGPVEFAWLDPQDKPVEPGSGGPQLVRELAPGRSLSPAGLVLKAGAAPVVIESVQVDASRSYHPQPEAIDMCPAILPPAGKPAARAPACTRETDEIVLANAGLRCRFRTGDRLELVSVYNELAASEMLRSPQPPFLFLVEVDGTRYAGSRDFRCTSVRTTDQGLVAELAMAKPALDATLAAQIETEGLRLALTLSNAAGTPVSFKLAFPHLAGLAVSDQAPDDYYFFPWGGGIIASVPAVIRRGYGDHEALYQVLDLFSPTRGAGLYLRADDADGWHKTLALRKHIPGQSEQDAQQLSVNTAAEYKWSHPFEAVAGTGLAFEYLRRTRAPGQSFTPAPAILAAHSGDWHTTMSAYAQWAHRVWRFRPYPSRLRTVHHMIAAGWGQGILFRDGKYRTDMVTPRTDCIELMSWWDWSPLGPWSTPLDRLKEVLTEAQIKTWEPYFVRDPVTGQTMWNNQPGDYAGYNERFGGLPAFRQAIATCREQGALVTLYTDPFRLDDACKTGQAHGKQWGVVGSDGKHTTAYEVWNPCHDCPEVRDWVAATMARVMRETGADGIRLDEYGHRGWACFSELHAHSYQERGVSQWQKAVADATRRVHEAMDQVRPGLVLTTEHPGYDYLMQYLEGCITYDLTVMACRLRPLECNLQRFYFPECKAYELDHHGADLQSRKKFWNGVESFGRYYPDEMYTVLKENEDVYQDGTAEPLLPTRLPHLYVNRFAAGPKALYHLYNATGHTVASDVLSLPRDPSRHVVELLTGQECSVSDAGTEQLVRVCLARNDVACVASLPRLLTVTRAGSVLRCSRPQEPAGQQAGERLAVSSSQGLILLATEASPGVTVLDLTQLPDGARPAWVKLFHGRDLRDAVPFPTP